MNWMKLLYGFQEPDSPAIPYQGSNLDPVRIVVPTIPKPVLVTQDGRYVIAVATAKNETHAAQFFVGQPDGRSRT
ncbi:hypothetical protein [Burkholderia sp. AW49-1]